MASPTERLNILDGLLVDVRQSDVGLGPIIIKHTSVFGWASQLEINLPRVELSDAPKSPNYQSSLSTLLVLIVLPGTNRVYCALF